MASHRGLREELTGIGDGVPPFPCLASIQLAGKLDFVNSIAPILLRCVLVIALVTGGASIGSASAVAMTMDSSSQAQSHTPDDSDADCHPSDGETAKDSPSTTPGDNCCSDQEDACTHENCNCVCPALTIVVPMRSAPSTLSIAQGPSSVLSTVTPQRIITTLLRPPRA